MRRLILIAAGAALLVWVLGLLPSDGDSVYRVDVVFDTSKGIVPGQRVKVAGVEVGAVEDVNLTRSRKARLTLSVDDDFAPFATDASCRILPEGLISENFVECDPGAGEEPLASSGSGTPTVPVKNTTVPVALQDVIDIFSLPVSQRIRAVVNELGIATAARGEDLNAILRRANPALTDARRALTILGDQRRQLADSIEQTDAVLAELSTRKQDVRSFVDRAAVVAERTAARAEPLAAAVRELSPMFASVEQGLGSLRQIAAEGVPLSRDLRAAAPELSTFLDEMKSFSRAGEPAALKVGAFARKAKPEVEDAVALFRQFRGAVTGLKPNAKQLALLMNSLREQGGFETVNRFWYQMAAMSGGYDNVSHYVGVLINVWVRCLLNLNAKGCSQAYSAPGNGTIPANAPSVGPQRLGNVVSPDAVVTAREGVQQAKSDPKAVKSFLRYLLK